MGEKGQDITCSQDEIRNLKRIARSKTAGIWRIKRAKVILGSLECKTIDRLVLDIRVPPETIRKCLRNFAKDRLGYLEESDRNPTSREASVEKMLAFLEQPPHPRSIKWNHLTVHYIGHDFSARQIKKIRDLIELNPEYSRAQIAHQVCRMFGLYQSDGKLKKSGMSTILKRMDMDNIVALPAMHRTTYTAPSRTKRLTPKQRKLIYFDNSELKYLQFIPVKTKKDSSLWNDLISSYHYIGGYRLFGAQMKYLVYGGKNLLNTISTSNNNGKVSAKRSRKLPIENWKKLDLDKPRGEHLIAVLGFAASSWQLSSRDRFIGWTTEQRTANLNLIVNNIRFLILPWIKSPNLASRILGGITRQLPFDWKERYGLRPVLLETFVQLDLFKGTCYRAANWIEVGITQGYSLYGEKRRKRITEKSIFLYPLCKNFRKILCKT